MVKLSVPKFLSALLPQLLMVKLLLDVNSMLPAPAVVRLYQAVS